MDKKEYNKKYYKEHKEELNAYKKEWYKDNPEWAKEYYKRNKDKIYEYQRKWQKKNKEKFSKLCGDSRKRRVERLREEGCINPWNVINKGAEPKYASNNNQES